MVKRLSSLVDQHGRAIEYSVLSEEVAAPTMFGARRVVDQTIASGLTPESLAALLKDAAAGNARRYLTLAEEMEERYPHYASQLQTRRLAIDGIAPVVEAPDGVPTKIVDAVNTLVEDTDFDAAGSLLTDGIGKGYAVVEILWDYADGLLKPSDYKWRDPRFFQFDRLSLSELRLAVDTNLDGEELSPAKFIRHLPRTKAGIPLRAGLARPAAWAFLVQSFSLIDWAGFAEVYGIPFRIGKYGPNASEADKRTLLRAVRMIASDAAAIIPQGMEIEFQKVEGQHGAAIFGNLIDYLDKQISKLVVGQTMTADDGSSLGQAKIHNEVRLDILKADCKQLARTLNRDLIEPFVALNFGPQAIYPYVSFPVAEPEDVAALADALAKLVPVGLRVSQREVREKIGFSDPAEGEELLAPTDSASPKTTPTDPGKDKPATLDAHHGSCRCPSCGSMAGLSAGSADDARGVGLVADLLADIDWEAIGEPLLKPVRNAIEQASSFEEALALIRDNAPNGTRLAEELARATAIARGIGDVED